MAKTVVAVNILTAVDSYVYSNHCAFWKWLATNCPDDQFVFFTPRRTSIDNMRNETAKQGLLNNADYIMFIDDDVIIPINAYAMLKETMERTNAAIVAGLTFIRSYPFAPMFFKKVVQDGALVGLDHYWGYEDHVEEDGTVDSYAIGTSLALIRVASYRDIQPPYFVTGTNHTEDVYFCAEVKRHNPDAKILVQTKCSTGHLLEPMVVSVDSVVKLRAFYKPEDETDPDIIDGERSADYVRKCIAAMGAERDSQKILGLSTSDPLDPPVPVQTMEVNDKA